VIPIFTYTSYRTYLTDVFNEKKRKNAAFSHRVLSQKLGLSTSNYVLLIMQGKRNLNPELRKKMSHVFNHSEKEALYFEHLVNFDHAKTDSEKNFHYGCMLSIRKELKLHVIDDAQYEYLNQWYNPVIRELVTDDRWDGDFITLGRAVRPPITASQAKRSVEILLKTGLITEEGGRYVQSSPVLTTVDSAVSPVAVNQFHREMCRRALDVLDTPDQKNRNMTGCTLHVSGKTYELIKEELKKCRSRLLELAQADNEADKVYHVNLHLFPVSTPDKLTGGKKKQQNTKKPFEGF
jgi:uncharacterized protein (TIGR02147 family)